ncbi:MAG: phytoene desaturase family protein [Candidatus Brocadiia bacterium]
MADPQAVGIIGGGLGGLTAACTLAARGYRVTLLERNTWLGGKAAVLAEGGFRFDMGPTILTVPAVLDRVFAEAGRQTSDELELVELDPQWRCFFEDGSTLDLTADTAQMAARLDAFDSARAGSRYEEFIETSQALHRISRTYFFWRPVGSFGQAMAGTGRALPGKALDVVRMRLWRTVAGLVRKYLTDSRLAQMADHFTQYVGSSPYMAPAILCAIAHMQTEGGVWYPIGGTRAVPRALEKLAVELGVDFRKATCVERILVEDGSARGVVTDEGEELRFAAVVSNADSVRTHRELLGPDVRARFESRRRCEPACSGVVLYLGLDRRYDHVRHHNFVFSRDAEEEFDAIYGRGVPAPDPTCYVCAPARTEPAVAPEGGEALYVLVHTPYLHPGQKWTEMLPEYRARILDKLARTGGMDDIEERIVFESVLTPEDILNRYAVLRGAIYGLASHGRLSGAFKPGNRSPDVAGLYLAGGSAHPGPGMPMAVMSGWIAADALDRDGAADGSSTAHGL